MVQCSAVIAITLSTILATATARPAVIKLDTQNFESYTQAATGQTTGTWFVLFTSSYEPSLQHQVEAWEELGESPEQVIYGLVDVADEPGLAERFSVSSLPTFLLFRNRKMYKYGGADGGPEDLRHFSLSGYKQAAPLDVPPEPSLLDAALKAIRRSPWTVRAMEAAAGGTIAAVVILVVVSLKQGSTVHTAQPAAARQEGKPAEKKKGADRKSRASRVSRRAEQATWH